MQPREQERVPLLKRLGPGLITGAADDDPSGIATYSQTGAQYGYGLLWSVLLTTPLMIGIQIVSARIGRVTGHGLAANIRDHYPRLAPVRDRRRCCSSPTPSTSPPTWAPWATRCELPGGRGERDLHRVLRAAVAHAADLRAVPALRPAAQVADAVAAGLRRRGVHGARAVERGDHGRALPEAAVPRRLRRDARGGARHHHQPLSLLLAGLAGGRGAARHARRTSRCARRPSRPPST